MFDGVWVFIFFLVQGFDAVIEAFEKGQAVDLSGLPPSPGQGKEHWCFYFCKQADFIYVALLKKEVTVW